mgnify:CR=1 FL=1
MSASSKLKEFIVDYLKIKTVRTPDLDLLRELCKDTPPDDIYKFVERCTRHKIRHELRAYQNLYSKTAGRMIEPVYMWLLRMETLR